MDKTTIEEKKAQILMTLRGYKLVKREEKEDVISLLVKTREKKNALIWCIPGKTVVGVAYANKLEKAVKAEEAERGIIVSNCRYTFAAKRNARRYNIELIPRIFPSFNIFKHKLVPKHEIITPEETKALFEEYRVEPYQLPQIKVTDIAAIAIGAKPGDIVKIIRDSPTAGEFISYRYVVP